MRLEEAKAYEIKKLAALKKRDDSRTPKDRKRKASTGTRGVALGALANIL
jgi:hypothetical protein